MLAALMYPAKLAELINIATEEIPSSVPEPVITDIPISNIPSKASDGTTKSNVSAK